MLAGPSDRSMSSETHEEEYRGYSKDVLDSPTAKEFLSGSARSEMSTPGTSPQTSFLLTRTSTAGTLNLTAAVLDPFKFHQFATAEL